jgi:formiminotetrahydrofolate cyclodeaminase
MDKNKNTPLLDISIHEFNQLLSSSTPAPGGGSAAALAGAAGASLGLMVLNLTLLKNPEIANDSSKREMLMKNVELLHQAKSALEAGIQEDTDAFLQYMEAIQMPKTTDDEKIVRSKAIREATDLTIEVPLRTATFCVDVLEILEVVAEYGNANALSDVGTGVALTFAALEGALMNVRINLSGIKDEQRRKNLTAEESTIYATGLAIREEIMGIVKTRMNG